MKVNVYEDNGGKIHALVCDNGKIINTISGFEEALMSKDEFVEAAQTGLTIFQGADDYD